MDPVDVAQWNPDEPPQGPLPGASASMRQVHVKAGHVAGRHSHPHEQFLLVMRGAGRLECEAGSVPLHPGTAIRFAPGAWHSAEITADTVLTEFNLTPQEPVPGEAKAASYRCKPAVVGQLSVGWAAAVRIIPQQTLSLRAALAMRPSRSPRTNFVPSGSALPRRRRLALMRRNGADGSIQTDPRPDRTGGLV